MNKKRGLLLVERDDAPYYVLLSLVAFGLTVVGVRLFLQLTGYPQIGSSTLHIAHLLWGGLLLFVAVLIVLIWDNPSVLVASGILSGIGIGLFIDEVGKFITQSNDYFFPAAAPIIYGFFLLTAFIYILVRRPDEDDTRKTLIHSLERLQDAIYGELDDQELNELREDLIFSQKSERDEFKKLSTLLLDYVDEGNIPFRNYEPSLLNRIGMKMEEWGTRLGRTRHRWLIGLGLLVTAATAIITLGGLIWVAISPEATAQTLVAGLAAEAQKNDINSVAGHLIRLGIEIAVGGVALLSVYFLFRGNEKRGILLALGSIILSLTAVQIITFYLNQFTAIIPTLFQFGLLYIILAYRSWYLVPKRGETKER